MLKLIWSRVNNLFNMDINIRIRLYKFVYFTLYRLMITIFSPQSWAKSAPVPKLISHCCLPGSCVMCILLYNEFACQQPLKASLAHSSKLLSDSFLSCEISTHPLVVRVKSAFSRSREVHCAYQARESWFLIASTFWIFILQTQLRCSHSSTTPIKGCEMGIYTKD